jgi:chaperone required for assembly of F1-ATPase
MKRFWKDVSVQKEGDGWTILLDGRPVKTPARAPLLLPTASLTDAVADEWRAVEDKIDPCAMPLTGLANAAIDRVALDKNAFARGIARYAEADLACYRAEGPAQLIARQEASWDALLGWARRRYDVDFKITTGLIHVQQPTATVQRLSHAVEMLGPFKLAGLSQLVTIGSSLAAGLAVIENAITAEEAWDAVSLDERWQLDQWGADAEAETALENRRRDFLAASKFVSLA